MQLLQQTLPLIGVLAFYGSILFLLHWREEATTDEE